MSRHTRHPLRTPVLLLLVVLGLNLAATVLWAAYRLLPWLLLAAAAVAAWRWQRRNSITPPRPPRVVQGAALHDDRLARVTAERDDLRRQVAQLRAAAARPSRGPKLPTEAELRETLRARADQISTQIPAGDDTR